MDMFSIQYLLRNIHSILEKKNEFLRKRIDASKTWAGVCRLKPGEVASPAAESSVAFGKQKHRIFFYIIPLRQFWSIE